MHHLGEPPLISAPLCCLEVLIHFKNEGAQGCCALACAALLKRRLWVITNAEKQLDLCSLVKHADPAEEITAG